MYFLIWNGQIFIKQDTKKKKLTIKEKIDKLNYIEIKNFSSFKDTIHMQK